MFSVIILSAGQGRRYGSNKSFAKIGDIPVFIHSLLTFKEKIFKEIILVIPQKSFEEEEKKYQATIKEFIPQLEYRKKIKIIAGGKERYDSVFQGLKSCFIKNRYVLIHDGARPIVNGEDLRRITAKLINFSNQSYGVVPVTLLDHTIIKVENDEVVENLKREQLRQVSTPQGFLLKNIISAYEKFYKNPNYTPTDDSEIYHRFGLPIKTILLNKPNPKLTTPYDYHYLKWLWDKENTTSEEQNN